MLPHIAVLSALAKHHSLEILYVGSARGPERGIVQTWAKKLHADRSSVNFHFVSIPVGKWRRYFDVRNFIDPFNVMAGFLKSLVIVARFKPDVIFSKGGYVSVPVTLAGWVLRVPIVLHDSDAKPSLTTRLCSRFAKQICLGYKEALDQLPSSLRRKCVITGIPLRREIFEGKKAEGYKMIGFTTKKPVVLVMGGSMGSERINRVVEEALPELVKITQVVHIVGPSYSVIRPSHNYKSFPSILNEKLPHLYAIADVVVTRAGANSLAELTALNKKMVVIPLGSAASHGDQLANAKVCKRKMNVSVLQESTLNGQQLVDTLKPLLTKGKIIGLGPKGFERLGSGCH